MAFGELTDAFEACDTPWLGNSLFSQIGVT
jgi:hypothetical protein